MIEPYILIIGAGKIGRSFIGQVFGRNGFGVVFVDMDLALVNELNSRKSYPVVVRGRDYEETLVVNRVEAIHAEDQGAVREAIARASIVAVSVGKSALPAIAGVLAEGLILREEKRPGRILDVILAENMRSADIFLREELRKRLPSSYPLDTQVGLVETSIGKMVPIITKDHLDEDPIRVFAEPYNTLILDKRGFRGVIPDIPEFSLKENMSAWVDRKAFIHNLGHATVAFKGFLSDRDAVYLWEVLADPEVLDFSRSVMLESAEILMALHPGEFTPAMLHDHISDLLLRFMNKNLGDTLFRVGRDLKRKLGPDDRFLAVIREAQRLGKPHDRILEALKMGFAFRAKDESGLPFPGDQQISDSWDRDPGQALREVCGLDPKEDLELFRALGI
jgi:mannitol-1-phosphate 5-dehydrogenase